MEGFKLMIEFIEIEFLEHGKYALNSLRNYGLTGEYEEFSMEGDFFLYQVPVNWYCKETF